MKNYYCLTVDDFNEHFKDLEDVKQWFIDCGIEDKLELEDGEYIELTEIDKLLSKGNIEIYNKCMIQGGYEYCEIMLEEIDFKNSK
jgi:hypothetical protein